MRTSMTGLLGLATWLLSLGAGQHTNGVGMNDGRQHDRLPCYVVVSDEVSDDGQYRQIRVLTEKERITERNLLLLQRHFSARYPDIEHLTVLINTSLNFRLGNYKTSEDIEAQRAALAGLPYDRKPKVWEKDARAILIRRGEVEEFGYKGEGGDMRDMKYFLVKGDDPECQNCKSLGHEARGGARIEIDHSTETLGSVSCHFVFGNAVIDGHRTIGVFINADDATEVKLRALLSEFSGQYPEPEPLEIRVYTDLKQSNDFAWLLLGDRFVRSTGEYLVAAIFRDSGNQVIRYGRANKAVTTVVVRGRDIFPDL